MPRNPPPLPAIRTIGLMQPMTWLVLAWRDMARAGWISFAHGLALTLFGAAIFAVGHHRFWLLAGALSGFMVVAPVLATSLYALSRALERGEAGDRGRGLHNIVRPGVVGAVDPHGLHACVQRALRIQRGVVAHVQHLVGQHIHGRGGRMEDAHIGLGRSKL